MSENPELEQTWTEISNAVRNYLEMTAFQDFKTATSVIRIPVVVHLIGDNVIGSISDARIHRQIEILNEDFRKMTGTNGFGAGVDTKIEFCLTEVDALGDPSSGVFTYPGVFPEWDPDTISSASNSDHVLKSLGHWSPVEFLNMYVTDLCCGVLGYASFPEVLTTLPERDGVVIDPDYFGISGHERYGHGRTATHEVGHWLGLRHTWGDGDCSVDDGVDDTPICDTTYFSRFNSGCPSISQCSPENAAANLTDVRQIENYMDYSDDLCMNKFTQGQMDRMLGYLATVRLSTLFSPCVVGGNPPPPPPDPDPNPCDFCHNIWPNFRINGLDPFNSPWRVHVCEGTPVTITRYGACKFWHCFNTFFSVQESNYNGTAIGTEYSKWYDYGNNADELVLDNLIDDVGSPPLQYGKYYRIKFANNFGGWAGVGWAERVRLIYLVPNDVLVTVNTVPSNSIALNKIETTGQNVTVNSGNIVSFTAQNKIVLNPGFMANLGAKFTAQIGTFPCPLFRRIEIEADEQIELPIEEVRVSALYPNPTTGLLTLQHPQTIAQMEAFDIFGRGVALTNPNSNTATIDLSGMAAGIYLIRATLQDGKVETHRAVLQSP